jgi:hypothetical protein
MFADEKEAGAVLTEFFVSIDAALKAMTNIHYSFIQDQTEGV